MSAYSAQATLDARERRRHERAFGPPPPCATSRSRSTRERTLIQHVGSSCSVMSAATAAPPRSAERKRLRRAHARTSLPAQGRQALAAQRTTHDDLVASWQLALDAAGDALRAAVTENAFSGTEARERERRLAAERRWLARWANPYPTRASATMGAAESRGRCGCAWPSECRRLPPRRRLAHSRPRAGRVPARLPLGPRGVRLGRNVRCRRPFGGATSCVRARCGTRTR